MTKSERLLFKLRDLYVSSVGNITDQILLDESENNVQKDWSIVLDLYLNMKKSKCKLKVKDILHIHLDEVPEITLNFYSKFISSNSNRVFFKGQPLCNKTLDLFTYYKYSSFNGAIRVTLTDNSVIYICRYKLQSFRTRIITLIVTEYSSWYKLRKLLIYDNKKNKKIKLKLGIYKLDSDRFEINYITYKPPSIKISHPNYKNVCDDIDFFFDNINLYKRYNQPVIRKTLLIGPPGTGKTTLLNNIASEYKSKYCFIYNTQTLNNVYQCMEHIKDSDTKAIIAIEDCDSFLGGEVSSDVLNFLDGVNTPQIKSGLYMLFTTNYPNMQPRTLRPGRIDNIITISELTDNYAVDCANMYLPDNDNTVNLSYEDKKLIFSNLTGSQIMGLCRYAIKYSISTCRNIDVTLLKEVFNMYKKDTNNILYKVSDNSKLNANYSKIGTSNLNEDLDSMSF